MNVKIRKILFIAVLILFFAFPAFGADYYFSQSTGNDDTGDGSIGTPWQTITKINSTAYSAGDTINLLRGDTWTIGSGASGIVIDFDGTSGSRITLQPYSTGNQPIIDASAQTGDGVRGNGGTEVCIYVNSYKGDYVTIDNLELKGAINECAIDGKTGAAGQYMYIQNCTLSGGGFSTESLISFYAADHLKIMDNTFTAGASSYAKAVELAGGSNDYCEMSGNTVNGFITSGGALRIVHGNYCIIEKNWIYGVNAAKPGQIAIVVRDADIANAWNVIRNNLIDMTDSVLTSGLRGISYWSISGETTTVLKVFNNTFISNGYGPFIKLESDTAECRNNIVYDFGVVFEVEDGATMTVSNTCYHTCTSYSDIDAGATFTDEGSNQASDPQLVNPDPSSATDFKVQSGSPCINNGTTDSGDAQMPSDDYWDATRTVIDIGAHEYPGVTIALTGTLSDGATEAQIVTGGQVLTGTVTGDTLVAAGVTFDAQRQNIIDGLTATGVGADDWNTNVRDQMAVTEVVRIDDNTYIITLTAKPGYNPSSNCLVTHTMPGTALIGADQIVATPAFEITVTPGPVQGLTIIGTTFE